MFRWRMFENRDGKEIFQVEQKGNKLLIITVMLAIFSYTIMEKNFDAWNGVKKSLETRSEKILFKEGDIWWTSLGINIATESCGKGDTFRRPMLVIKKLSGKAAIVIPLTSQEKTGTWFQEIYIHGNRSWALLYQVRMMSTNRFQRRLATLDDTDFERVKKKLQQLLEL